MSYIKTFEKFEENIEDDNNHFDGIDISDLDSFEFIWSNRPFISDYKNIDGEYGSSDKRIILGKSIYKYLKNITKEKFKEILKEEGFIVSRENILGNYSFKIEGKSQHFFDIIKSLKYLI